ncbi:MAG: AmmeMemoRadiSam system radical SAM enzyme [Oligoflexia bacterium]|nr:AmmeMemoRadiSam system radical SAM enzyme [Oligoflexia bacterium]
MTGPQVVSSKHPHAIVPGRWWRAAGDRFVCDLCPRRCHLRPGQRGFCFVRQARPDGIALTTWGHTSGFCIDPVEKKPLNHFLPGSPVLSFGTAGCNLGCRYCQNWEISKARQQDATSVAATPQQVAELARRTDSRAVAFTYNDPVIFAEYALDVAAACHQADISTIAVTAGYITAQARPDFFAGMDAANIDLKAFTERFYRELCYGRLEPVKETLRYLVHETDVWVELTTLLIPGENDSDDEINALSSWICDALGRHVPLHFTAYHPDYRLDRPATSAATLSRARAIARAEGLHHVYTGNVHDVVGNTTWCHACGTALIRRDWYDLHGWGLDPAHPGRCGTCGTTLAGRFEAAPGTWGGRRMSVRPKWPD